MKNVIISLKNVNKSYELYHKVSYKEILFNLFRKEKRELKKEFLALQNINFDVSEGECVGIIGKNGSGKSTLLGLIAGVMRPTKGSVKVYKKVSPLLELGGGFHLDLNAYENIRLNGVILGISLKKIEEKIENILKFSEIGEFANQPIHVYSSGMLARLGFSIVTQLEPELLLIDEVLAVGDEKFRKKCLDLMLSYKEQGISIVLVSHNAEDIQMICDRVIWIDSHEVIMDGKTDVVLDAYHKKMLN